ncbi:SCO family protein [Halopiger djelfimassiliensis]|uniref:SCO family protein n=1 Tax=Halopiger djelfimassiliensis TaxID=1293047 RepID=UPI0006777D29|nr:SCO family protein [Halopiger djelfimassiliensis]
MERRTYLGSLGAAGVAGMAGCLGSFGIGEGNEGDEDDQDGSSNEHSDNFGDGQTVLEPPSTRRGDPSYPIHGEEFPAFSLPDPLSGETVSRDDFVGERPFLMTYFFTSCPDGVCPALLLRLRRVQEDAAERGYADDIALLAMTFDPERDTPDALEEYAAQQGVDLEAGNWHFLRPESYEGGKETLEEDFGMRIEKIEEDGGDEHDGDHDHGEYTFQHISLIMLVNEHGVVERAYPWATTSEKGADMEQIVEETRTVAQE